MIRRTFHSILIFVFALLAAFGASAEPDSAPPERTFVVGVKVAPPFVIEDGGSYRGLAIVPAQLS